MAKFDKKEYNKKYRKQHEEYYRNYNKKWFGKFDGSFLYIILEDETIRYVGKTTNIYQRISKHLSCNVEATKEIFEGGNWTTIKYIDLTNIVDNDKELRMLENTLIELYEPSHNSVKNIIKNMDKLRELQLCSYLHHALSGDEWKIYKINENTVNKR